MHISKFFQEFEFEGMDEIIFSKRGQSLGIGIFKMKEN